MIAKIVDIKTLNLITNEGPQIETEMPAGYNFKPGQALIGVDKKVIIVEEILQNQNHALPRN